MANNHMRMRVQRPMLTTSDTAPMVQKPERLAAAPKTKARANAASATLVDNPGSMGQGLRHFAASKPKGWGLYSRSPVASVISQQRAAFNNPEIRVGGEA